MRRLAPALAIVSTLLFVAPSAEAITRYSAKQLAASLAASHIFVQPGVAPQPDSAALKAVAAQTPSTYLLILRRQVKGAKTSLESAKLIIAALKKQDPKATVGLIAKGQLAGSSLSHPQERVDKAVKDSKAVAATDPVGSLTSFVTAVSKPNVSATGGSTPKSASYARPLWQWGVVVAAGLMLLLVALRLRARSRAQKRRRRSGSSWTARDFHEERLDALASRHSRLTSETTLPSGTAKDPAAADHLQTASARILALRRTLPSLSSPRELRTCAGELDAVEWELLWVEHRLSNNAPPAAIARGLPGLCFFTHEHGLGTEPIELRRPDGTNATVYVSPANRLALERGDAPEVSLVQVGTQMIPWPAAPTWYGAYGWTSDDLPGLEFNGEQIWGMDGPEREDDDDELYDEDSSEYLDAPDLPPAEVFSVPLVPAAGAGDDNTLSWEREETGAELTAESTLVNAPAVSDLTAETTLVNAPAVSDAPPADAHGYGFEELDEPLPPSIVDARAPVGLGSDETSELSPFAAAHEEAQAADASWAGAAASELADDWDAQPPEPSAEWELPQPRRPAAPQPPPPEPAEEWDALPTAAPATPPPLPPEPVEEWDSLPTAAPATAQALPHEPSAEWDLPQRQPQRAPQPPPEPADTWDSLPTPAPAIPQPLPPEPVEEWDSLPNEASAEWDPVLPETSAEWGHSPPPPISEPGLETFELRPTQPPTDDTHYEPTAPADTPIPDDDEHTVDGLRLYHPPKPGLETFELRPTQPPTDDTHYEPTAPADTPIPGDDEHTVDGLRLDQAPVESTLDWDPFAEDFPPPDQQS